MSPDEMQVVEANSAAQFCNRELLINHTIKHLIEGRDERWQALIDERLLIEARQEYRQGKIGAKVWALARRYQLLVSDLLREVCEQRRAHQHACSYRGNVDHQSLEAIAQIIDAWPEREKMVIAAVAFVTQGTIGPYQILTAFRPWPGISLNGHKRKARERQRNLESLYPRRVLEIHDD